MKQFSIRTIIVMFIIVIILFLVAKETDIPELSPLDQCCYDIINFECPPGVSCIIVTDGAAFCDCIKGNTIDKDELNDYGIPLVLCDHNGTQIDREKYFIMRCGDFIET